MKSAFFTSLKSVSNTSVARILTLQMFDVSDGYFLIADVTLILNFVVI